MPDFIRIHPNDNVAVALASIPAGTVFSGVRAAVDIPRGNKMALKPLKAGDQVVKYGFSIGHATQAIAPGQWVHTHNMKTNLSGEEEYTYNPCIRYPAPQPPPKLPGLPPEGWQGGNPQRNLDSPNGRLCQRCGQGPGEGESGSGAGLH